MKYLRLYENFEDFEETWIEDPYEDTEIKVGDKILVTDKLKDYIIKYDWPDKMYDFIDAPKSQLGFIAQEIKTIDLLKPSIHEGPGFIPNIYRNVSCDQGRFELDVLLKKDDIVRYKKNGKTHTSRIINASNTTYQLEEPLSEEVFLYGTEVQDFHSLEKDMIFTLSVSAIQQLDEIVTQQQKSIDQYKVSIDQYKVSIDDLKSTLQSQQKTIDQLLQKINTVLVPQDRIM